MLTRSKSDQGRSISSQANVTVSNTRRSNVNKKNSISTKKLQVRSRVNANVLDRNQGSKSTPISSSPAVGDTVEETVKKAVDTSAGCAITEAMQMQLVHAITQAVTKVFSHHFKLCRNKWMRKQVA